MRFRDRKKVVVEVLVTLLSPLRLFVILPVGQFVLR